MANKVELYNNGTLIGTDNAPTVNGTEWSYSIPYTADSGNDVLTAKAFVDNVEVASSGVRNVVVNASGGGGMTETFSGTTIDTEKFTVINPNAPGIAITQNNALLLNADGVTSISSTLTNRIEYNTSFVDAQCSVALSQSGVVTAPWAIGAFIDTTNFAAFLRSATAGKIRIIIRVSGTDVVSDETGIDFGNATNLRYTVSGTSWTFEKSINDGTSWTTIGSYTANLTGSKKWYAAIGGNTEGVKNITITELKIV